MGFKLIKGLTRVIPSSATNRTRRRLTVTEKTRHQQLTIRLLSKGKVNAA